MDKFLPSYITNNALNDIRFDFNPYSIPNVKLEFPNMSDPMAKAVSEASQHQVLRDKIKSDLKHYFYGHNINGDCESQ